MTSTDQARTHRESTASIVRGYTFPIAGILRILIGFYFFWAFIDKLFGFGFGTPSERAWLNGGSPVTGFLTGSIEGGNPFASVWEFLISDGVVTITNVLFMVGLFAIGLSMILGIGQKVYTVAASAMYFFMYLAALPISSNPIYDDHLLMIFVFIVLLGMRAGDYIGLGKTWEKMVGDHSILR